MTTTSTDRTSDTGHESPQRGRFPWWLLLVLLVVVAVIGFLVARGGDDPTATSDQTAQQEDEGDDAAATDDDDTDAATDEDTEASDAEDDAADEPTARDDLDPADIQPGKVVAGGATVYPLSEGLTVGDYDGADVVGTETPVESVIAGEGFWIGTSTEDRVFVSVTDGTDATDLSEGDVIDFEGVVVKHGRRFAERIGVTGAEARQLTQLGGHIEVASYRPAE